MEMFYNYYYAYGINNECLWVLIYLVIQLEFKMNHKHNIEHYIGHCAKSNLFM